MKIIARALALALFSGAVWTGVALAADGVPVPAAVRDECVLAGMNANVDCLCVFRSVDQKIAQMDLAIAAGRAAYSNEELAYLKGERKELLRLSAYIHDREPSYVY